MDYEVNAQSGSNPHLTYTNLREKLNNKIIADGNNPLNYITQTTNIENGLKMTATYSEQRKQHFLDHPLGS